MFNLTQKELSLLKKLNTPAKIQDFINSIPGNFEEHGDICMSPRRSLRENTAHCMEGALLAAATLYVNGHQPLIMDLKATQKDFDHVVTLFTLRGRWGAISKTNHAVLRFREPVYRDIRELATSYFHEYFTNDDAKKTLRSFSRPLNLSRFDRRGWMTDEKDVFYIPEYLDSIRHYPILTRAHIRALRRADAIEVKAGKLTEWKRQARS